MGSRGTHPTTRASLETHFFSGAQEHWGLFLCGAWLGLPTPRRGVFDSHEGARCESVLTQQASQTPCSARPSLRLALCLRPSSFLLDMTIGHSQYSLLFPLWCVCVVLALPSNHSTADPGTTWRPGKATPRDKAWNQEPTGIQLMGIFFQNLI